MYPIDLSPYKAQALPQSFLDALGTRLSALRGAGAKAILRPRYSSTESCDDAPLNIVQQHLAQLKPVFAANADVIAYFQAGMIGAWGEGWCSTNSLHVEPGHSAVRDALLDAVPTNLHVAFQPVDLQEWQSIPRISSKNDCFLASNTDRGQFPGGLNDPLRDFIKTRTGITPYGGETCDGGTDPRTSCPDILNEGREYHLAYLNQSYARVFIDRWKTDGCFEEVRRSIGYRLRLDSVSHPATAAGSAVVSVSLSNDGWARIYSKRPLVVTLKNKATGAVINASAGDLNSVAALTSATIGVPVSAPVGSYDLFISAPDIYSTTAADPHFSVRFANADAGSQVWNSSTGRMATGTVLTFSGSTIELFRPGSGIVRLSAFPNPGRNEIVFSLSGNEGAREIDIYSIAGRHMARLSAGSDGLVTWDATGSPPGVYVVTTVRAGLAQGMKILLMK
jgi:hypothetical protein